MKISLKSKEVLDQELGKGSFWLPTVLASKLAYISGIDGFDEQMEGKLFTELFALINFTKRPNGLQISLMKNLTYYDTGLTNDSIKDIILEDKELIIEKQEKSVVARAIIGGLILGPVGAVIGGLSGMGTKEVKANMPDLILSITYQIDGLDGIILFSCKYKDKKDVEVFLSKNYKEKFILI
jgi:hypothetical protein